LGDLLAMTMTTQEGAASPSNELTPEESQRLYHLERKVRAGLIKYGQAITDVGQALAEIKERRLYRQKFKTFEAYCQTVLGKSARTANRILSGLMTGDKARIRTVIEAADPRLATAGPKREEKEAAPAENLAEMTAEKDGKCRQPDLGHQEVVTKSGHEILEAKTDEKTAGPSKHPESPEQRRFPTVPPPIDQAWRSSRATAASGGDPGQAPATSGGQQNGEGTQRLIDSGLTQDQIQAVQFFIEKVYRFHCSTWNNPPPPPPMKIIGTIIEELERVKRKVRS